jgi:hypothetical protein
MTMIYPEPKMLSSTEFIKVYSSSMFKMKKLIANNEIKAIKRNGRYIINAESAAHWYKSLFGEAA